MDRAMIQYAYGKLSVDRPGHGSRTGCSQIFIAYDPYLFGQEEEVLAFVQEYTTRSAEEALFEAHDVHFDIQYVVSGKVLVRVRI